MVVREDGARPRDLFMQEDFQLMGWPDEVHYGEMTPEKIARVIEQHIGLDAPVESLRGARED